MRTHSQNIGKVWEAEEKVKKEQAHVDELRKKFSEEQKIEDMRKIQIDAGLLPYVYLRVFSIRTVSARTPQCLPFNRHVLVQSKFLTKFHRLYMYA